MAQAHQKGHTIEKFYKIIGYPKDFKPINEVSQKNQTKNFNINSSVVASGSSTSGEFEFHLLPADQYIKFFQSISEKQ